MTWDELLDNNHVTATPTSLEEITNLRSIVTRSFNDAMAPGLSADARFIMAYDAARSLSLMIIRSEGYRPRAFGGHYNTFLALEAADPTFAAVATYFDGCRMKRNGAEYDFAGGITETDADGLLQVVRNFSAQVKEWLRDRYPDLAPEEKGDLG